MSSYKQTAFASFTLKNRQALAGKKAAVYRNCDQRCSRCVSMFPEWETHLLGGKFVPSYELLIYAQHDFGLRSAVKIILESSNILDSIVRRLSMRSRNPSLIETAEALRMYFESGCSAFNFHLKDSRKNKKCLGFRDSGADAGACRIVSQRTDGVIDPPRPFRRKSTGHIPKIYFCRPLRRAHLTETLKDSNPCHR